MMKKHPATVKVKILQLRRIVKVISDNIGTANSINTAYVDTQSLRLTLMQHEHYTLCLDGRTRQVPNLSSEASEAHDLS